MPNVPHPILDAVRCVRCKWWISCGPIRLLPNGKSLCGRCQTYKSGPNDNYRHFAFEALACYFKFPCKYWGNHCPESLPFKKVLEHEKRCSYNSTCSMMCSHFSDVFKNKRYINKRAEITLEVIPDEVLEYLRCGSCAGYLSCTPIYVCRDGTSLCHRCSSQIQPSPEFLRDLMFEKFVDMMIFPCIYRYRGCTEYIKFGIECQQHESECAFSRPIISRISSQQEREPLPSPYDRFGSPQDRFNSPEDSVGSPEDRFSNLQKYPQKHESPSVQRQESIIKKKERGVITTPSGRHIYATLSHNAPFFAPKPLKKQDNMFYDEFEKHKENLASKWARPSEQKVEFTLPPAVEETVEENVDVESKHTDSAYGNMGPGYPSLINELKFKQEYIRKNILSSQTPNGNLSGSNGM